MHGTRNMSGEHDPRTITPLFGPDLERFLSRVPNLPWNTVRFPTHNPSRVAMFIYDTGCHQRDIAHPEDSKLHVLPDGRIARVRAKKSISSPGAYIVIAPSPRIRPWYREFIDNLPTPRCTPREVVYYAKRHGKRLTDQTPLGYTRDCSCHKRFNEMVRWVGETVDIPGLTPRTLRHTFGYRLYRATKDINVVMDKMGCSMAVALRYAHLVNHSDIDDGLASGAI